MFAAEPAVSDDWMKHGTCARRDPRLWDGVPKNDGPYAPRDFSKARAICLECPVRRICLARAVETEDTWCMRGGKDPEQLKALVQEHKRQRSQRRTKMRLVVPNRSRAVTA